MSKIKFEVSDKINTTGTNKRGTLTTTFNTLVRVFGEPQQTPDNNTFNEWRIQFEAPADDGDFDYVIATIYDWNLNKNPRKAPNSVVTFIIGGKSMDAAYYVHQQMAGS